MVQRVRDDLHQSQGGIDNNVVGQQQLDYLFHLRRVWIDGVRFWIHHDARQIFDMVNLVHAVLDSLNCIHAKWNMAGYGHAQPMRFSRNNL